MVDIHIHPSKLHGHLTIPSSKSHTLRAIVFAALAQGISTIKHYLPSPDTSAMIEAVRLLGATVKIHPTSLEIKGCGGILNIAEDVIQCGNSGIALRFIGALAGLISEYTILTGDYSLRHNRHTKPLLDGLNQLGATALSSRGDMHAPLIIKGPFTKQRATIDGQDSQPVSALLIASAFAPHPTELHVTDPGEKPWIDLTLYWFKKLGIKYQMKDYSFYQVEGSSLIKGFTYTVPGDFSTAAFPIAAALITRSELTLHNIDMDDIQGDKALIPALEQMGAHFNIDNTKKTLTIKKDSFLKGGCIDINDFIDSLPILSVIACFAEGKTEIVNAAIARKKECDRIACITSELKKMGAQIEETSDGVIVHSSILHGAKLNTHHDHRLALSLSVAALASGSSTIHDIECIAKTYSSFCEDFQSIGANIHL